MNVVPPEDPQWVHVYWPDETCSVYGIEAARESLEVEKEAFEVFKLGSDI